MKRKIKAIIWPVIYLVLIINVCFSFALVFRSYYFKSIFVSGESMQPTLNNNHSDGKVDYGIIDVHRNVLSNLHRPENRFKIVITYYPFKMSNDYDPAYVPGETNTLNPDTCSYKIKRLYGLPGETIRFSVDEEIAQQAKQKAADLNNKYAKDVQTLAAKAIHFYVTRDGEEFEPKIKFQRKIDIENFDNYNMEPRTLGENEYWVMGDNYSVSSDCMSKDIKEPIYYDNLVGVLVAIEGRCNTDFIPSGTEAVSGSRYACKNREIHFPKFY